MGSNDRETEWTSIYGHTDIPAGHHPTTADKNPLDIGPIIAITAGSIILLVLLVRCMYARKQSLGEEEEEEEEDEGDVSADSEDGYNVQTVHQQVSADPGRDVPGEIHTDPDKSQRALPRGAGEQVQDDREDGTPAEEPREIDLSLSHDPHHYELRLLKRLSYIDEDDLPLPPPLSSEEDIKF